MCKVSLSSKQSKYYENVIKGEAFAVVITYLGGKFIYLFFCLIVVCINNVGFRLQITEDRILCFFSYCSKVFEIKACVKSLG